MTPKQPLPSSPGITPGDVYYILFRHKWLIAILSAVAIAAAIVAGSMYPVTYESEAELMIKYVHDNRPVAEMNAAAASSDVRGETVVGSEIKVLTSYDLALDVADAIPPGKILARAGGGTNRIAAANVVRNGLQAVADKTDVIEIKFTHPDPDMVQPILLQLIEAYLNKHREVHEPPQNEVLQRQKEDLINQIKVKDKALQELRQQAGYTIGESYESSTAIVAEIFSEKLRAEAELAGDVATIRESEYNLSKTGGVTGPTNAAPSSNSNNAPAIPAGEISKYQKVRERLNNLEAQEDDLLYKAGLTTNATRVQLVLRQIDTAQAQKQELEGKYPGLANAAPVETKTTTAGPTVDPRIALRDAIMKADALAARIQTLTNQLAQVQSKTANMSSFDSQISQLLKEREVLERLFDYSSQQVEEARVKEVVGPGNSNIKTVEEPTPPTRNMRKFNKMISGILFGGLAFALALPFFIEFYLDRTLKRPLDVQHRLGVPFFMSIPSINGNGASSVLKHVKKIALLGRTAPASQPPGAGPLPESPANGHLALWEMNHGLQPFYETLRDRLMTYFEVINLTHKPKLVAVTSCAKGAGVTSTAAGLASSLSETGDGNVLLVNMNGLAGEAHHFFKGKLACGLDEVLEKGASQSACVQDHLYVAKEQPEDERLPRVLPKRFSHLLPKMKASDFDYIIFDMPPVNQISITPRLARFMDMVLLVIESEKTDRDVAARAAAMLSETKTNVGVVLNKNRAYGPRSQHHDV